MNQDAVPVREAAGEDALFLSDAHLGAGDRREDRARQARLLSFLEGRATRAGQLFILGDLFDFWFEYRHVVPRRHLQVLLRLRALAESGVRITYFGGNHDFWVGSFLADEVGAIVHQDPARLEVQGRRLFLMHGDGMARGDRGYKLLKGMLRNPVAIAAYRWLHPDVGIPLAYTVSRLSRASRDESKVDREWLYRQLALPRFAEGADAVVTGHYHHPTHFRRDGRDFLILGDWVTNFTFASLIQGRFQLERWTGQEAMPLSDEGREYPAAAQEAVQPETPGPAGEHPESGARVAG
jgi:UDP-2,3-diacylglucosamine hydrolase